MSPVKIELVEANQIADRTRVEQGDDELFVINAYWTMTGTALAAQLGAHEAS